jgi:hypothetical protein
MMEEESSYYGTYGFESEGDFKTEAESVAFLKELLKQTGLFTVYNEVKGQIIQPRPFVEKVDVRIDFILSPKPKLMNAGWPYGTMGVECKKSGLKINKAFSQTLDYSHSVWKLPSGFLFMCEFHFLWPFPKTHGFLASIMAQNKIGTLHNDARPDWGSLKFYCGETKVLKYRHSTGEIAIGKPHGNNSGSR